MKRSQAFLLKAADALELPQELLSAFPRVTLEGDQLLSVENHGGVRRYTPECIEVHTALGVLQIEPTQKQIREIFLNRIIQAKGLSQAAALLSDILMPTPSAVLLAMAALLG